VYVDDILITRTDSAVLHSIIALLQSVFAMKDLGNLGFFLGMQAHLDSNGLHIRPSKYIIDLLHKSSPAKSPILLWLFMAPSFRPLQVIHCPSLILPHTAKSWVPHSTAPSLGRTSPTLSTSFVFMHSPTSIHWIAAKRVLRYLKGSVDHGLLFRDGSLTLAAYCDSDWAGDSEGHRSTTSFGVFLGPCPL